jgi:hypothetical protein
MAYGEARRKILFYRVNSIKRGVEWDRDEVCRAINALRGADVYYDDGEQIVRAEVFSATRPHMIRFFKVRRDELPAVDDGAGDRRELELDDEAGLIEAIHLCLFPNGIIGAEFFFYGPRISRFQKYLNVKLQVGPFEILDVIRHDVIEQALRWGDIRLLRIKVDPSVMSREAAAAANIDGLLNAAQSFDAGVWAELTLRAESNDDGFKRNVKGLLTRLKNGSNDAHIFEKLEIEGKPTLDDPVTPLDILSERMYRMVEIPYRAQRHRDLNSDAAFAAIRQAYREVARDIPRDGVA